MRAQIEERKITVFALAGTARADIGQQVAVRPRASSSLRLLRGDAYTVLHEHVAASSLDGVRIYFPDPWPKRRHHKRRFVRQPEFVALVTSRLAVGATLHLATDWEPYAQEMLATCVAEPGLRNTAEPPHGFATRPAWRPVSSSSSNAPGMRAASVRDLLFARP